MKKQDKTLAGELDIPKPKELFEEERLFNEINILRLEGYYFCLDPKAAAKRVSKQSFVEYLKTPEEMVERPLHIEPHPTYGYPGVLAYKILQATMKKLSDYGYPAPENVSFSQRELARLCGRKSFGGGNSKEFFRASMQLNSTKVWCSFYDKETKEWQAITFYLIDSCLFSGKGEQIQQCVFHIHPSIIKSLNNRYALCLNYSRMEALEPIAIVLFKRLFFHFSHLYSQQKNRDFSFTKDYGSICRNWLGGIKPERYKSLILSNQLGRHLKGLRQVKLIKAWDIEKNSEGDGFNITFYPGEGFFEDYAHFYKKDRQLAMQFARVSDERKIQQPMELVSYFYKRLYQLDELEEAIFSDKETAFAAELLGKYAFSDIQEWIDYAIRKALESRFDIKSFGGIKVYGNEFWLEKKRRTKQKEDEQEQREAQQEHRLMDEYGVFRRDTLRKIRANLKAEELASIEASIKERAEAEKRPAIGLSFLIRAQADQVIAERFGVPSFEQWRHGRA